MLFGSLSNLYATGVITFWSGMVFGSMMTDADGASYIPRLIWAYVVATTPISVATMPESWLVDKEQHNFATSILAAFAQIGFIFIMVTTIFFRMTGLQLMGVFAITVFACQSINLWLVVRNVVPEEEPEK